MIMQMLKKLVKIRSNSELAENTKSAEIQKKKKKEMCSKKIGRKYRHV